MSRIRTSCAIVVLALLAAVIGIATPSAEAKPNKVDLCQRTGNGTYHLISVSGNGNAVNAHLAQGGGFPGGAVPDMDGYEFDDSCVPTFSVQGCVLGGAFVETAVSQPECDALVDLYVAANGSGWINADGWNTASDPCEWHGVTCQNGALTALALSSNGLTGSIPPSIGALSNLTRLRLAFNQLSGGLPASIGDLVALTDLQLNNNQLTGTIPSSLGNLSNLLTLRLNLNSLSGPIPDSLGGLTSVEFFELWGNDLTGSIPSTVGSLTNVVHFRVELNDLSGPIPVELYDLTTITLLRIQGNQLTGPIAPEVGQLTNLNQLLADDNQLSGPLPAEIGDLDNIATLRLNSNALSGPVPATIQALGDTLVELRLRAQSGCLTADPATSTFLDGLDNQWDSGCP